MAGVRQARATARGWHLAGLLLCLVIVPPSLPAAAQDWMARAEGAGLPSHPEWLALLHYGKRFPGRHQSFVDDPRFFLSPDGVRNPGSELAATLRAFFTEPASQCRFVARRSWLAGRLPGLREALPVVPCDEYGQWRALLAPREVVLVFASSYLNSPSSMYGHTFLRFDSGKAERASPWLSWALNFGASIPPGENGLLYAYRGLAGGYPGEFAAAPYFAKLKEYSRIENRDLWEYRLSLDDTELDRLVEHVWELRDINFDYYFFDENCSLRILELLDVARPGLGLSARFPYFAIPADTVRAVIGAGLVGKVEYRPASLTILDQRIAGLTPGERRLARRLAEEPALTGSPEFLALPPGRRSGIVAVAFGYHRYEALQTARTPAMSERGFALLRAVNRNAAAAEPVEIPRPVQPDDGHRTMLLAATLGQEAERSFGEVEWRLSYHDLLDAGAGYPDGASLNMGRAVVRLKEEGTVRLQRFDLLEITSLSSRNEFFRPFSWRVNAGWDRQWTNGHDELVTQVNAGVGGTWLLGGSLQVFTLLTGRIEHNDEFDRSLDFAPGISLGGVLGTRFGRTMLTIDRYRFTDEVDRTALGLGHNLPVGRSMALRFGLERRITESDRVNEMSLSLRRYF